MRIIDIIGSKRTHILFLFVAVIALLSACGSSLEPTSSTPSHDATTALELNSVDEFSPELPRGNYATQWRHDYMEQIARQLTGIHSGEIMRSDLDKITTLNFRAEDSVSFVFQTNLGAVSFETDEPIRDLHDLEHFGGLQQANIRLPDVENVEGLRGLQNVQSATLFFSEQTADLRPVGSMTQLRRLMMWGVDYRNVEDISFFDDLQYLERLRFTGSSIDDVVAFTRMGSLVYLSLDTSETLDTQPLANARSIQDVKVNSVPLRINGLAADVARSGSFPPRVPVITDNIHLAPFDVRDDWYTINTPEDLVLLGELIRGQVTFSDGTRAQDGYYLLANRHRPYRSQPGRKRLGANWRFYLGRC